MIEPYDLNGINQNEESYYNNINSFEFLINDNLNVTEYNETIKDELSSDKNEENNEKYINEYNLVKLNLIKTNKKDNNKIIFITNSYKSIGRRSTNITYNEKAPHNSNSQDNLMESCFRDFTKSFITTLNYYNNLEIKKTNFKKQFGSSNIKHQKFIKLKIYQFLTYNPPDNNKYQSHKNFGSYNKNLIYRAIKENNKENISILKSTIEEIYNIYISDNKNKVVINGIEYNYFKKLSDVINEKREEIKNLPFQSQQEKENDLKNYERQAKNLIKYIKGEGQVKKRKQNFDEKDIIKYLIIKELE